MEIVTLTNNARFARVKLGEIRPNRFRDLARWPVERSVIDGLKQSINETGFWNNLQAIRNERDEVELRFGHHRWTAGLELFGPDYEVAVEMVPFQGEWSLLRALHMENAVNRNKVMHTHEVVAQLTHWWDDVVFEKYPSWEECVRAAFFSSPQLAGYFGPNTGGGGGYANYAQCVKYGIGREVIAKMLEGTETKTAIEQALASLPLTARRKRGLELQAEEERRKAEELRAEADRIKAERERLRAAALEEEKKRQAEIDRVAAEKRKAEAEAKAAKDAEAKRLAEECRQEADRRREQLESEKAAKEASHQAELEAKRKAAAEAETKARQAEFRANDKEKVVQSREWFDARAAEVFDRPSHGSAFRIAVSHDDIRPYLQTQDLVPFARAIREHLERDEAAGKELTADRIREMVLLNFRTFKKGLQDVERVTRIVEERNNPVSRIKSRLVRAIDAMQAADSEIGGLLSEINLNQITQSDFGVFGDRFDRAFKSLEVTIAEFKRLRKP